MLLGHVESHGGLLYLFRDCLGDMALMKSIVWGMTTAHHSPIARPGIHKPLLGLQFPLNATVSAGGDLCSFRLRPQTTDLRTRWLWMAGRIMELPLKRWNDPLFPRDWQARLDGVWYSTLVNVLSSVGQLFVLLRSEDGASWVVRRFSTQSREWHEMPHTASSAPLGLHSASDQTLVYFREAADGSRAMMAHSVAYVPAKQRDYDSACLVGPRSGVEG